MMDKETITEAEAEQLVANEKLTWEYIKQSFNVVSNPRCYSFNVEKERQYAIKVLNVISNLKQKERDRVLSRALKLNKM